MKKEILLVDGLGAVLSSILLWIISFYEPIFGVPRYIIAPLAILPILFSVYSFSIYFFIQKKWQLFLKIIAFLNLFYCFLNSIFILLYFPHLKILGVLYFLVENIVIILLVVFELKIASENIKEDNKTT